MISFRALKLVIIPVDTTGGAGVATGQGRAGIPTGIIARLAVDFNAAAPATTDTTISTTLPVSKDVLTLTNTATDVPLSAIKEQALDNVGVAIAGEFEFPIAQGELVVDLAQCDALTDAAIVTALIWVP